MARHGLVQTVAIAALLLVVATILGAAVPARAGPAKVTVSSITFLGSGCNRGNTAYILSSDGSAVTFLFAGMIATTDSGLAGARKNCIISLGLTYPNGWSFSLGKVIGRGYANLGYGVKGTYQTSYFISGQSGTAYCKRTICGKKELNYEYSDNFGLLVWSQCSSVPNLNINVEVRVSASHGRKGIMTVDSVDKKFKLTYYLKWKKC